MVNTKISGGTKNILMIFVGLIIAIVFLQSISNSVFNQTNTFTSDNETFTVGAINVSVSTTGRDLVGTGTVDNFSVVSGKGNFTGLIISDGLVNGTKTVILTANDTATNFVGNEVNVSYTYNPEGYLTSSSDRSIANLIVIFGTLAALVFVIVMLAKNGMFEEIMRTGRRKK